MRFANKKRKEVVHRCKCAGCGVSPRKIADCTSGFAPRTTHDVYPKKPPRHAFLLAFPALIEMYAATGGKKKLEISKVCLVDAIPADKPPGTVLWNWKVAAIRYK